MRPVASGRDHGRALPDEAGSAARMMDVTWVGHATAIVDVAGQRVITDPLLTRRVAHLRRRRELPRHHGIDTTDVDLVLISHAHLDHLHLPSLRPLDPQARVLTPLGTGALLRKAGFHHVTEVEVGDTILHDDVTIEVVNAAHEHGRGPHSRVTARPVGYVISGAGTRCYFPGDTDLFDAMADLRDIDVALLPIWGWGSTLGVGHLTPERAAEATRIIRPALVVPIHWGTYAPENGRRKMPHWFEAPPLQFVTHLEQHGEHDRVRVLEPGQQVTVALREDRP
jgi:L-ascorbate metabolism protein UlaG (beta-lactamase superfamily)